MRVLFLIIFAVVLLFGVFIVDAPTMLILLIAYFIGITLTRFLNKSNKNTIYIYSILFLASSLYMIACYLYMSDKGYIYLFAPDIYGTFFPMNEQYLQYGNYTQIVSHIWEEYRFFDQYFVGYYTYSTLWGVIARGLQANLYVTLQISTLFLYSFIGVITYKLFLKSGFTIKASYKNTLIISLISIVFFYSTIFIRDIHIALLYLLAIYLTFDSKFSLITLIKIVALIFITCTFRIESGLFLFILIPTYLLLSLQKTNYKIVIISASVVIALLIGFYYLNNRTIIETIVEDNRDVYVESVSEGSGIIGTLQRIPVAGDILSIFYNAIQPVPFWSRLEPTSADKYGAESYNIMRFPQAIASIFNWIVLCYLLAPFFSRELRRRLKGKITIPLVYQLIIGFIFFLLQSAVISQRRLIPYYIIYYILFFIIHGQVKKQDKKVLNMIVFSTFIVIQIFSALLFN